MITVLFAVLNALGDDIAQVPEVWVGRSPGCGTLDSVTACETTGGSVRVFVTAKKGCWVDVFDGSTGRFIERHGQRGSAPGQFRYPNGIVSVRFPGQTEKRHFVLVVERDNARVQVFRADDFAPLGAFGKGVLHHPYGAAVSVRDGEVYLYVTDTWLPADRKVHIFRLMPKAKSLAASHVRSFGDRQGAGAVREAESIVVDDAFDRVFLCDEHPSRQNVKVYTTEGRFTGATLADGLVQGDPEGIALYNDGDKGLVILTDQQEHLTRWHLFDRRSLVYLGTLTGNPPPANTDGICLYPRPFGPFRVGALIAIHDDTEVRAYEVRGVIGVLGLSVE
jgi:3-phytase